MPDGIGYETEMAPPSHDGQMPLGKSEKLAALDAFVEMLGLGKVGKCGVCGADCPDCGARFTPDDPEPALPDLTMMMDSGE